MPQTPPAAPPIDALALWHRVLDDPAFRDLPYKVETNARGQIVMSPHTIYHSNLQGAVIRLLAEHAPAAGHASPEYAIQTRDGVKVCDVVWISTEQAAQIPEDAAASPVAPEICVEVLSRTNTVAEMDAKRALYAERGAAEVWLVAEDGAVTFLAAETGERLPASRLAPTFPARVDE
jgi:Uma2 family endonuclease